MSIDYPGARLGKLCLDCGEPIRVRSAKRLIAGKTKAHILVQCDCYSGTYRPTKAERIELLRMARH